MDSFSENLRKLRSHQDVTQKEMAELVGMSPQGYGKIENGTREPNLKTLSVIADVLNVSVDYLLGRQAHPSHIVNQSIEGLGEVELHITIKAKEPSSPPDQR